jgi:copper chaperone
MTDTITYSVPGMSSGHCRAAITAEVSAAQGVQQVDVDLVTKLVQISGTTSTKQRSSQRSTTQATKRCGHELGPPRMAIPRRPSARLRSGSSPKPRGATLAARSNEAAAGGVAVVVAGRDDHNAGGFFNPRCAKMEQP